MYWEMLQIPVGVFFVLNWKENTRLDAAEAEGLVIQKISN